MVRTVDRTRFDVPAPHEPKKRLKSPKTQLLEGSECSKELSLGSS